MKIFSDAGYPTAGQSFDQWLNGLPRPLVFTNGCFDILHRGHVTYLQTAATLGAGLVVGVNSDESVRAQGKGEDRPINHLDDRMAILAALEVVSGVIGFGAHTPLDLIIAIKPDHLVKGGDWAVDDIVGAREVRSWGGEVHSIAFEYNRSTTDIIRRIRS